MPSRHHALVQALADGALATPGQLDPALRRAAFLRAGELAFAAATDYLREPGAPAAALPPALLAFVEKLARAPGAMAREDVSGLREAGLSEEMIFELVTAASVGAGLARLQLALRAVAAPRE